MDKIYTLVKEVRAEHPTSGITLTPINSHFNIREMIHTQQDNTYHTDEHKDMMVANP
jgi:hypothetical protein